MLYIQKKECIIMSNISASDLKQRLAAGEVTLIDVREPAEFAGGHVPGARNVPLGQLKGLDIAASNGKALVLVCASGRRSAAGCAQLAAHAPGALSLEGGTAAWVKAGGALEGAGRAIMPLDRQVPLAAGSLAALGFILGVFVNPWFHALSGFVGAGLMVAGLTGFCGMALVLARAPWNQRPPTAAHS
jgi:rhodanese-related sulfurtransferase